MSGESVHSDDLVYHYCSLEAFLNIVRTRSLWLTNIFFMNDKEEHYWLRGVVKDVLNELRASGKTLPQDSQLHDWSERVGIAKANPKVKDKADLFEVLEDYYSLDRMRHVYCACFSQDGDSLSQFRSYADDGRGVAIGVSRSVLKRATKRRNKAKGSFLDVRDVIYDIKKQRRKAKLAVEGVRLALTCGEETGCVPEWTALQEKIRGIPGLSPVYLRGLGYSVVALYLWTEAACCKNPAFAEEKEVRLVHQWLDEKEPPIDQRGYRAKGDMLAPYYIFPLLSEEEQFIRRIVFGPKCQYKLSEPVARMLLKDSGFDVGQIEFAHSSATYR